jgi:hypothetical protein
VNAKPIVLKGLLKQRHLQTHSAFQREYDRVAKELDPSYLKGSGPSKAQFYRWLSGELVGLPYTDHCRVLEHMFSGWTVDKLFQIDDGSIEFVPEPREQGAIKTAPRPIPVTMPTGPGVGDLVAVFPSRSEFIHDMPPRQLFDGAQRIRVAGLSLNILCQQYPDKSLVKLLESGATVECLFVDPQGEAIKRREQEEGHPDGVLSTLTDINISAMRRVRTKLSAQAKENLLIRTYDETIRFNITIIDDDQCIAQPYLPDARGVESPTLVMERQADEPGLFETFTQVFEAMWERSKAVTE